MGAVYGSQLVQVMLGMSRRWGLHTDTIRHFLCVLIQIEIESLNDPQISLTWQ